MSRIKYDDEFKLEMVRAYLENPMDIRMIARSFAFLKY